MPAVRQSQMKRIEGLVAQCAAGPGTLEQVDAGIATLDATDRGVSVVQARPTHDAARRRVGRDVRDGRVARIEQVMPPGLLRVQHGHETVILRPAGAVAATLAELDGAAHAIVGRLVSFDDQLGLAFELFGDPDRQELVLREYPTVRQSDLVLGPRTARMLEHLVLLPVRHPELARRYGVDVARFCIFAGPPGVGKTHAGRWLAAELGRPLFLISGGDIASEWYSVTEARLRARIAAAAGEPAGGLVFWDEAESMLIERGRSLVGVEDRVVATLLAATDGFAPRGHVLVVLTPNL